MEEGRFFERPILNSPYEYPGRHRQPDASGQPTQRISDTRRRAEFITPISKPASRRARASRNHCSSTKARGLSTQEQQYDHTAIISSVRQEVDKWRALPNPNDWHVTPETARLLQHRRHHAFSGVRPFFCQVEAVETAIWLSEVAPQIGKVGQTFIEHLASANQEANPGLMRPALKLATGTGKTTVMAILIAWQTINAVPRPGSKRFTRGYVIVAPGLTIRDRLCVLRPNDPASRAGSIDTDYNEESFFVRHAYFLGANDPYKALKTTLKAEIDVGAWATLNSDTSRAFDRPKSGRIAVKVINHLGDEVMKVFKVA